MEVEVDGVGALPLVVVAAVVDWLAVATAAVIVQVDVGVRRAGQSR